MGAQDDSHFLEGLLEGGHSPLGAGGDGRRSALGLAVLDELSCGRDLFHELGFLLLEGSYFGEHLRAALEVGGSASVLDTDEGVVVVEGLLEGLVDELGVLGGGPEAVLGYDV